MFAYLLLLPALVGAQTVLESGSESLSISDVASSSAISSSVSLSEPDVEPTGAPSESATATEDDSGSLSSVLTSVVPSEPASSVLSSAAPGEPASTSVTADDGSFTPFPLPSHKPLPPLFPSSDPLKPPAVDRSPGGEASKVILPDFAPAWKTAYERAKQHIADYSLEEKVNVATGVGWEQGRCVGNIPAIRNWGGLCLQDAPSGIRFADHVTSFPAGVNAAATWNRRLIRERADAMGREFRGKGVNIALGPAMNMARVAAGGRNWEGFGADPFLAGEASYESVLGIQAAGVQACAKHWLNNEQEHKRTTSSSDVGDRTNHEIYAHPFLRSVQAGVASVMCAYNLINGTYACENNELQNDILKEEYGFQGYILSDWQATMSTISADRGLDMSMPGDITFYSGNSYFGQNLTDAVNRGEINEGRVDDMATRILAGYYFAHQDKNFPPVNFDGFRRTDESVNEHVDVQGLSDTKKDKNAHARIAREVAAASAILLKNNNQGTRYGGGNRGLPLTGSGKLRNVAVIGSDASYGSIGPNEFPDHGGVDGIVGIGWGSGTSDYTYQISPLEAIQARTREERTAVNWMLNDYAYDRAINAARRQGAALVFIQSSSGEEYITYDGNQGDRRNLTAWHDGDRLVETVAAQNNNTIVIVHSSGQLVVEPWIDHPNITAVVWGGLGGQEAGNAIVDVLWGDVNPSGKLPYTIAKRREDYGADLVFGTPQEILPIPYDDKLLIDYRWFDAQNIEPRFEFGFGMSYTSFEYSNLRISSVSSRPARDGELEDAWANGIASPQVVGGSAALWLHRPAFEVQFRIKNTGGVLGTEIPQVYIHFPDSADEPPSVLRGFTDIELKPGQQKNVKISLSRYDLSFWDTISQGWKKADGEYGLSVGASSRDFKLRATVPF
ncbi:glycoside hydrolase superfamily [Pterulicium gracile]|uniref:beta-glucosidase n=1 Tax=Pterulicium gracile TaxID=1884261 RepID=A0A5C3R4C1_9AGAR|nr:glycoside hydrolase superfamily [Pterula gracilis]